jgi:hypothetical protein
MSLFTYSNLCSINRRVKQLKCAEGYVCKGGYQRRAVEWSSAICTCDMTREGDPANQKVCYPTAANQNGRMWGDETPTDLLPPWTPIVAVDNVITKRGYRYNFGNEPIEATWACTAGSCVSSDGTDGQVNTFY